MGLRARVTTTFALGALAVSATLAGVTYFTARQYVLHQKEVTVQRQAYADALLVRSALRSPNPDIPELLLNLDNGPGTESVLDVRGQLFASGVTQRASPIHATIKSLVTKGTPATQVYTLENIPQYVVGVPLPAVDAAYFEVSSLGDLARTLDVLALTLALGALATAVAAALLGRWASGRALRPLTRVASVAAAIAGGDLGTRLETGDAADLSALASSFNRMADRVQERIEREARFTSDVSHELRSPLTTLANSLDVLEKHRDSLPERAAQALDLLGDEISRFQRMVGDLLEISRFDAGSAELSLEEVRVEELVTHAVAAATRTGSPGSRQDGAGEGHDQAPPFAIVMAPDLSGARLRVDKRRMERVIANLVENAQSYAGGVTRLLVERGPGTIRIAVEDKGPGIPVDERAKVFDRFYRGPASRRREGSVGTGLGLSLVAEHVHLHKGKSWIEEAPGGGTRVVVEIPELDQPQ